MFCYLSVFMSGAIYSTHNTGTPIALYPQHLPLLCVGLITSRLVATLHNAPSVQPRWIIVCMLQEVFSFSCWCSQIRHNRRLGGEGWLTDSHYDPILPDPPISAQPYNAYWKLTTPDSGEGLRVRRRYLISTIGFVPRGPSVATCICWLFRNYRWYKCVPLISHVPPRDCDCWRHVCGTTPTSLQALVCI
jgi:hypothetical protein